MRTLFAALVCFTGLAAPRLALACSVCSAYREDAANRAFVLTTIFLSVTPLLMFGGFGAWLYLRHKKRERALAVAVTPTPAREPVTAPRRSLPELS
ncbi:MAG TPA: hypothetical protein VFY49_05595 [Myxococcota bacterium]|nr:hypothetical protein [Myxococcota bacterium]